MEELTILIRNQDFDFDLYNIISINNSIEEDVDCIENDDIDFDPSFF
jgi:hypothetical protein